MRGILHAASTARIAIHIFSIAAKLQSALSKCLLEPATVVKAIGLYCDVHFPLVLNLNLTGTVNLSVPIACQWPSIY